VPEQVTHNLCKRCVTYLQPVSTEESLPLILSGWSANSVVRAIGVVFVIGIVPSFPPSPVRRSAGNGRRQRPLAPHDVPLLNYKRWPRLRPNGSKKTAGGGRGSAAHSGVGSVCPQSRGKLDVCRTVNQTSFRSLLRRGRAVVGQAAPVSHSPGNGSDICRSSGQDSRRLCAANGVDPAV
jgi:hypothetical protein